MIDHQQAVKIKGTRKFPNNPTGFKKLGDWVGKRHKDQSIPLTVTMGATGVYYEKLALYLTDHAFYVSVVLPNKAKNYLLSKAFKSKNDQIDAKGLAQMGAEQKLSQWSPLSKYFYKLRSLTRHYQGLQELKTVIVNQLEALRYTVYQNQIVIKQQESMRKKVEKDILKIKGQIKAHISSNETVSKKVENITAIKGLGLLTVATVLAETALSCSITPGNWLVIPATT